MQIILWSPPNWHIPMSASLGAIAFALTSFHDTLPDHAHFYHTLKRSWRKAAIPTPSGIRSPRISCYFVLGKENRISLHVALKPLIALAASIHWKQHSVWSPLHHWQSYPLNAWYCGHFPSPSWMDWLDSCASVIPKISNVKIISFILIVGSIVEV